MTKRPLTKFRLIIWIVGFAALGLFLYQYTPWSRYFRTDYRAHAADGTPLVAAVYEFRNQRGLWPQDESDLVPQFIAKIPDGWWYDVKNGWPQVTKTIGGKEFVGYDFDPQHTGYYAWGNLLDEKMDLPQEIPPAPKLTPEELQTRILVEYERRLRALPDLPELWQAKGAYLYQIGRKDELTKLLDGADAFRPHNFWPKLGLAKLELDRADKANLTATIGQPFRYLPPRPLPPAMASATSAAITPSTSTAPTTIAATTHATQPVTPIESTIVAPPPTTAGEKFVAWSVAHPSFTRYFYVYAYARFVGDDAAAIRAAELAMTRQIETADEDHPLDRYYYLYRLARFAYQARQYPLCLQICTEWQTIDQQDRNNKGRGNRSYYPLAAAANLALGEYDRADALAQQCGFADSAGPRLMARNYDALADAARRRDSTFAYVPNPDGAQAEYDPFTRWDK